jgi:hypothetical protein
VTKRAKRFGGHREPFSRVNGKIGPQAGSEVSKGGQLQTHQAAISLQLELLPKIAHTWDELEQKLEAGGANAEGALA